MTLVCQEPIVPDVSLNSRQFIFSVCTEDSRQSEDTQRGPIAQEGEDTFTRASAPFRYLQACSGSRSAVTDERQRTITSQRTAVRSDGHRVQTRTR